MPEAGAQKVGLVFQDHVDLKGNVMLMLWTCT